MFAYCEDTELSLRCWQRGWRVVFVPEAVVLHRYEFSRNANKLYLLERNRLFVVLTPGLRRMLAAVLGPLLVLELAMLAVAVKQGWGRRKLAGWWWLLRNAGLVRERRRQVRAAQSRPDAEFARVLTGDFAPGVRGLEAPAALRRVSSAYWQAAKRAI